MSINCDTELNADTIYPVTLQAMDEKASALCSTVITLCIEPYMKSAIAKEQIMYPVELRNVEVLKTVKSMMLLAVTIIKDNRG